MLATLISKNLTSTLSAPLIFFFIAVLPFVKSCSNVPSDENSHLQIANGFRLTSADPVHRSIMQIVTTTTESKQFHCSGVLIAPTTLLTAAHCFADKDIQSVIISSEFRLAGSRQTVSNATFGKRIALHPDYDRSRIIFGNPNDIAIVQLSLKIPGTEGIRPQPESFVLKPHAELRVHGSGDILETSESVLTEEQLESFKAQKMVPVNYYTHIHYQNQTLGGRQFRAVGEAVPNGEYTNSCVGDSGGPVVAKDPVTQRFNQLVGLVASGPILSPYECEKSGWGFYTDLRQYKGWITCAEVFLSHWPQTPLDHGPCKGMTRFWERKPTLPVAP